MVRSRDLDSFVSGIVVVAGVALDVVVVVMAVDGAAVGGGEHVGVAVDCLSMSSSVSARCSDRSSAIIVGPMSGSFVYRMAIGV